MALFQGRLLETDIASIIANDLGSKDSLVYEVTVHTVDADIPVAALKNVEVMRNYSKYVGDYIVVGFNMYGGDFIKDVYPHRDNLEMTISVYDKITNVTVSDNRYKLVLINNNANVYGSKYMLSDREQLNRTEYIYVEGQCIDRVVEGLRLLQVEGIYENTNLQDIIMAELTEKINTLQIDGATPEFGIDIAEPSNPNLIDQLIIPTGIHALDFPSYLQNTVYGIYNAGIGTYIQNINNKPMLFVYPLYDVNRFDKVEKKCMVFYAGNTAYNVMDNTYLEDGDVLKIIAGTNLTSLDNAENEFMSEGSGFIRTLPQQMLNRNVSVTDSSMNLDAESQLEGTKFKDRTDGVDKPIYLGNEVNMYKYRSEINKRSLGTYQFQWHFSNPELIYPGMPIQYIYEDDENGITKLTGIIHGIVTKYDNVIKTMSSLIIFMAKKPIVYNEDELTS